MQHLRFNEFRSGARGIVFLIGIGGGVACSGGEEKTGDGAPGGGASSTGGAGNGATGGSGQVATGGGDAAGSGGAGDIPGEGGGGQPAGMSYREQAIAAGEICVYGYITLEVDALGDANLEGSVSASIDSASFDMSSGTRFLAESEGGPSVNLLWMRPAERPDVVGFRGVVGYTSTGGLARALCVEGQLVDAHLYPAEPYYTFAGAATFLANPDGSCSSTPASATVTGCVSENYFLD